MIYVMASPNGDAERYRAMLREIDLKESDILYVLGDIADGDEDGMEILTDMSMRVNVYPVAGERDLLALRMLSGFDKMLKSGGTPDPDFAAEMTAWVNDGGMYTLNGFRALDEDMREGVLDYLSEFSLYEEVEVGGKSYVLTHAGIGNFDPDTDLEDYAPEDFFTPAESGNAFFPDRTLVVSHGMTAGGKAEKSEGLIRLGAAGKGRPLACICLDTEYVFYV